MLEDTPKTRKRAVMDWDFVVNTLHPDAETVRQMFPESHYCIARLLAWASDFAESTEHAAEAASRFLKAYQQQLVDPLVHCVEMVVTEQRLAEINAAASKTAANEDEDEVTAPPSLRELCARRLARGGKYGGKSLPGHFHIALGRLISKVPQPTGAEWSRCSRHLTLAWSKGADLQPCVGLAGYAVYMGKRKVDSDGTFVKNDGPCAKLSNLCVTTIIDNEEAFPSSLEFLTELREQNAADGGGGGKKKK